MKNITFVQIINSQAFNFLNNIKIQINDMLEQNDAEGDSYNLYDIL